MYNIAIPALDENLERVLVDADSISRRVFQLAAEIDKDYEGCKEPIVLVGLLKGAFVFMADLGRALSIPHVVDFMSAHSYGDATVSSGKLNIRMDIKEDIKDKDVLIVEDIVDSGRTLSVIQKDFISRGAKSVRIVTLLNKPSRREAEVKIDYCGFEIPDYWVVGYGLDYAEKYRTLPYVAAMKVPEN